MLKYVIENNPLRYFVATDLHSTIYKEIILSKRALGLVHLKIYRQHLEFRSTINLVGGGLILLGEG